MEQLKIGSSVSCSIGSLTPKVKLTILPKQTDGGNMTLCCPYCGHSILAEDIRVKLIESSQMQIREQCQSCYWWFGVMMNRKDELVFFEVKKKK